MTLSPRFTFRIWYSPRPLKILANVASASSFACLPNSCHCDMRSSREGDRGTSDSDEAWLVWVVQVMVAVVVTKDGLKFHCRIDVGGMLEANITTIVLEISSSRPITRTSSPFEGGGGASEDSRLNSTPYSWTPFTVSDSAWSYPVSEPEDD